MQLQILFSILIAIIQSNEALAIEASKNTRKIHTIILVWASLSILILYRNIALEVQIYVSTSIIKSKREKKNFARWIQFWLVLKI